MKPKLMFLICIVLTAILYYLSIHLWPLGIDADVFQTATTGIKKISLTPRYARVMFCGVISFF